ncbi:MAG: hypothetical protein QNJ78_04455 [Gammaproteobacteria bacterium]|nr:hypothetical protein [Gammaproteobacteria bacterium]
MHTGRLVLTPHDPYYLPDDIDAVIENLRDIQFCADPVADLKGSHYLLGERFMQLVSFMGCSPFIQLEPSPDGEPFCHLFIVGPYPEPVFLRGRNTGAPRCESCRKRIPDWPSQIIQWQQDPGHYQAACPHCAHQQNPAKYNWRQSAGSGRLFLCIENIFPNEAIPSPELMQTLEHSSTAKMPWGYFYIQD